MEGLPSIISASWTLLRPYGWKVGISVQKSRTLGARPGLNVGVGSQHSLRPINTWAKRARNNITSAESMDSEPS